MTLEIVPKADAKSMGKMKLVVHVGGGRGAERLSIWGSCRKSYVIRKSKIASVGYDERP